MKRMKKFINGFKLMEYTVPLAETPIKQFLSMSSIGEILKLSGSLLLSNIKFGIKEYHFEKVHNDLLYKILKESNTSKSFTKVYVETFPATYQKEIHLNTNIFMILIDDKMWKLSLESYLICETPNLEKYDQLLINFLIDHINFTLGETDLIYPVVLDGFNVEINPLIDYQLLKSKKFNGYIKTFGDEETLRSIGFEEFLPEEKESYQEIADKEMEDKITESISSDIKNEGNQIIVDVVKSVTSSVTKKDDVTLNIINI